MTRINYTKRIKTKKYLANKIKAIKNKRRAINFSQKLISNATPAELILKKELEKRNVYFEFQKAVPFSGWKKRFYIQILLSISNIMAIKQNCMSK